MPSAEQDLKYLHDAAGELERFLLSKEVYWPLGVARLSLGALLLALQRIKARRFPASQQTEIQRLVSQVQAAQNQWGTHWAQKAAKEFPARLLLWEGYLKDYAEDPQAHAREYPQRVEWRVMLELLRQQTTEIPQDALSLLGQDDRRLRLAFVPGEFIWEPELASAFSPEPFWYLYGRLGSGRVSQ